MPTISDAFVERYSVDLTQQSTITFTPTITAYLPSISRSPGVIYGRITLHGQPAPNETIHLYAYCFSAGGIGYYYGHETQTVTDNQGNYRFYNMASMPRSPSGRAYCYSYRAFYGDGLPVEGGPIDYPIGPSLISHSGRIYAYATRSLETYTAGTTVELENFDVNELVATTNISETVTLPTTFKWKKRDNVPGESYEVWLMDYYCRSSPCIEPFSSGKLGNVDNFVLVSLPNGYAKNTAYDWLILAHSLTGGVGYSPYLKVTFK